MTINDFYMLLSGLKMSLFLTVASLLLGCFLAFVLTVILVLKIPVLTQISRLLITLLTGTPLLVQIYLTYYGLGMISWLSGTIFGQAWFCAILALSLNSAAYSTQLFHGAFNAINEGQWQACQALGMNNINTMRVLLPYAVRRAIPTYSNEVILVFKGTSLASTITIMDVMGYAQRINNQTYDTLVVFSLAGLLYLVVNSCLTLLFRVVERKVLAFERMGD